MNYAQQDTHSARLIWPITHQGKSIAQQFSRDHAQPDVVERVRRNTLAVWVIHEFLEALGISTDLSTSDSWNPAMQLMEDVADLVVPGVGRLECRPVAAETEGYLLPREVLAERIGYVVVELDEVAGEASLLGFVSEVRPAQPQLRWEQLQPMDEFPDHLHQLRQGTSKPQTSSLTQLSQWLEGQFESGWRSAEELLAQHVWTPAFRQGGQSVQREAPLAIKRAKQLDLGLKLGAEQVALVLEVGEENESVVKVGVRLYPLGGLMYLPEGLAVAILDEAGTVCLTAQARSVDNYLQLYFRGRSGEPFTAQVTLDEVHIVEHFVI
ncbi:DUF1822 family protein [Leptolyngbya cf. ectocarpi LEGE 11479]|uniref:DUF1822 family protein n=1 Tax=Leptolyngbya cf. ectocarpi LEGE 11479 TaxID=1828722 RepID=A0A928WZR4_LEPEC|nr:DUF1822 family protein [Leptolyngbya ectocarpi]MBE9065837.1 DUF1822 family protein [Leptolyngbya cf. ectocarpi LEGE 11479]